MFEWLLAMYIHVTLSNFMHQICELVVEDGRPTWQCSKGFELWISCVKLRLLGLHRSVLLAGSLQHTRTKIAKSCFGKKKFRFQLVDITGYNYKRQDRATCLTIRHPAMASVPIHFSYSGLPLDLERSRTHKN